MNLDYGSVRSSFKVSPIEPIKIVQPQAAGLYVAASLDVSVKDSFKKAENKTLQVSAGTQPPRPTPRKPMAASNPSSSFAQLLEAAKASDSARQKREEKPVRSDRAVSNTSAAPRRRAASASFTELLATAKNNNWNTGAEEKEAEDVTVPKRTLGRQRSPIRPNSMPTANTAVAQDPDEDVLLDKDDVPDFANLTEGAFNIIHDIQLINCCCLCYCRCC